MTQLMSLVILLTVTLAAADFYDSRYDNFDVTPLIENERILTSYTKCFLDKGPCTPEGKEFKKQVPEAIETTCGRCTPKQKELIRKVINTIVEKQPEAWKELLERFDPEKKYRSNLDQFLKEQ